MLTKLTHVLCRSSVFLYSSQTLFCAFPALFFVFFFACDWHAFAHDLPSLWPANGGEWCGWWVRVNCNLRATWRPSNGLICHLPGNRGWAGTSWIDCSVNLNFASELCFSFAASYCAVFTPPRIHLQAAHTNWVNLPPPSPLCSFAHLQHLHNQSQVGKLDRIKHAPALRWTFSMPATRNQFVLQWKLIY